MSRLLNILLYDIEFPILVQDYLGTFGKPDGKSITKILCFARMSWPLINGFNRFYPFALRTCSQTSC